MVNRQLLTASRREVRLTARRKTLPCSRGGGVRVFEVVTSKGACGQPFEGSTSIAATPSWRPRDAGLYFSVANSLRSRLKAAVLRRGSDARGGARWTVQAMFGDHDSRTRLACRKKGARVRDYRRRMSSEVSCCSVIEFNAYFYRTEWERVSSRRAKSVQKAVKEVLR